MAHVVCNSDLNIISNASLRLCPVRPHFSRSSDLFETVWKRSDITWFHRRLTFRTANRGLIGTSSPPRNHQLQFLWCLCRKRIEGIDSTSPGMVSGLFKAMFMSVVRMAWRVHYVVILIGLSVVSFDICHVASHSDQD